MRAGVQPVRESQPRRLHDPILGVDRRARWCSASAGVSTLSMMAAFGMSSQVRAGSESAREPQSQMGNPYVASKSSIAGAGSTFVVDTDQLPCGKRCDGLCASCVRRARSSFMAHVVRAARVLAGRSARSRASCEFVHWKGRNLYIDAPRPVRTSHDLGVQAQHVKCLA